MPPGAARDRAWAEADKKIVADAPAVPWVWDDIPLIAAGNVNGVANAYFLLWDLSFTSLR